MVREPKLLGSELSGYIEDTVMADDGFETSTEGLALDPVHHISVVRMSKHGAANSGIQIA